MNNSSKTLFCVKMYEIKTIFFMVFLHYFRRFLRFLVRFLPQLDPRRRLVGAFRECKSLCIIYCNDICVKKQIKFWKWVLTFGSDEYDFFLLFFFTLPVLVACLDMFAKFRWREASSRDLFGLVYIYNVWISTTQNKKSLDKAAYITAMMPSTGLICFIWWHFWKYDVTFSV